MCTFSVQNKPRPSAQISLFILFFGGLIRCDNAQQPNTPESKVALACAEKYGEVDSDKIEQKVAT